MSQWAHVAGCIRVDCLRHVIPVGPIYRDQLETILGTDLPRGSEGPLELVIHENPMPEHLAAFAAMVFGDLRDFGPDDVPKIEAWMGGVARRLSALRTMPLGDFPGFIRNAVVEVEVESHGARVWHWDGGGGRWVELSVRAEGEKS